MPCVEPSPPLLIVSMNLLGQYRELWGQATYPYVRIRWHNVPFMLSLNSRHVLLSDLGLGYVWFWVSWIESSQSLRSSFIIRKFFGSPSVYRTGEFLHFVPSLRSKVPFSLKTRKKDGISWHSLCINWQIFLILCRLSFSFHQFRPSHTFFFTCDELTWPSVTIITSVMKFEKGQPHETRFNLIHN